MKLTDTDTPRRPVILDAIHIFGLSGIAIAYPIFLFLRTNPAYLVVNEVPASQLRSIILFVSVLGPVAIVFANLVVRSISTRVYSVSHMVSVAGLVGLGFLPLFSRFESLPVWFIFLLCAVVTVLFMREYWTNPFIHWCLCVLLPIAIWLPIQFANDVNIRQILNPETVEDISLQPAGDDPLPPIVMIVYDEFPLIDLLDADGEIDAKRFPNFGALRDQSVWYANATTVHDQTLKSVPSMLTGRYPEEGTILPLPENYPESLFNLLRGYYDLHTFEPVTNLSDTFAAPEGAGITHLLMVVSDLAIFYTRSLLPEPAADNWLPLENGIWGGFLERMPERRKEDSKRTMSQWLRDKNGSDEILHRWASTKKYIAEMGTHSASTFHFFHVTIPHHPYDYLPSGQRYTFEISPDVDNVHTVRLKREAHILQAGLADTMLGEFRAELERLGRWDDALVVLVADHGEGYSAEANNRILTPENLGYIGFIPLFIKYPGQESGERDDTNVQTIDIAPTVLDALKLQNLPDMDGRSLVDKNAAIPDVKTFISHSGNGYRVEKDSYTIRREAARMETKSFFALDDLLSDLFNYGPGTQYLGKSFESLKPVALRYQVGVFDLKKFETVNLEAKRRPHLIKGQILNAADLDLGNCVVVVCVNGTARAVTRPFLSKIGQPSFHKVLPEGIFKASNEIELLLLPATTL